MQPRDFFRHQPKQLSTNLKNRWQSRVWRWLISGGVIIIICLVFGWLLSTGISSLLLPMYPEVIVILPESTNSGVINHLVVLIFHQDAHRTSGHLLRLTQPLALTNPTNRNLTPELSFTTGLMINQVIILPEGGLTTGSLRWQFWKLAQSNWQKPVIAFDYLRMGLITQVLEEEAVSDLQQWGEAMAKQVRSLEVRSQNCSIGVSNTVGLSGLGRKYANFLAQQGAAVRRVTNATTTLPNSQVLVDEKSREDCADTIPVISHLLSSQVPITHQAGVTDLYRVPMMILLGSDSASRNENEE